MDDVRSVIEEAVHDVRAEHDALDRTMLRVRSRQRNRRIRAGATAFVLTIAATTVVWRAFLVEQDITPAVPEEGRIVFTTMRPGDLSPVIAVIADDGSDLKILGPGSAPAWSPDGTMIAFSRTSPHGSAGILVMNSDGSDVHELTSNPEGIFDDGPSWSPDGRSIVFSRNALDLSGADPVPAGNTRRDLYTVDVDGTNLTKLIGGPTDDFAPDWSPDGTQIAFVRTEDPASDNLEGMPQIWALRLDGSEPVQLIALEQGPYRFDWSPAGSLLVLDAACAIYVVEVDTGVRSRLALEPEVPCPSDPAWSSDGTRIAFTAGPDDDHDIYVANADGTGAIQLTGPGGYDSEAAWWEPNSI